MARSGPARIAFFDAYSLSAGAGIALRDLVARLDRDRFSPMALLPREGPLAGMLREADCPVEIIEPPRPLDRYGRRLAAAGGLTKIRAALALASYARTVSGWLREREVDLLHCNQTRATVIAGPGGRLAGVPVVWNVRIRERLPRPVVRLAAACSKLIISLTEHDFQGLPDEPRLLRKSTVIRNAVDTDRFTFERERAAARARLRLADGTPVVLGVGVLVRRKGFGLLIRAIERVRRRVPGTKLLIAGEQPGGVGGARGELEALATELGVADAVTLLGQRDDVPELLAACDVFALPSRHEGDPASVLEAMATARPVVVTPAAAAAVQDGRTGLVVPTDDVEALAEAIASLLADPGLRRELGRAGRAVVEDEHDMAAMVRAYEDAWESVLR